MLVYFNGLILGMSLIITLGPQNIFLIKQGARNNHAVLSALTCFICDIVLIGASIAGLHQVLLVHPALQIWMMRLGCLFLLYYASQSLKSAFSEAQSLRQTSQQSHNRTQIMLLALSFSLLNPHAIIDSIVIIGGGSSEYPNQKLMFLTGVLSASLIWFSSLTFTARYFSDVLTRNAVWKTIELISGLFMLGSSVKLAIDSVHLSKELWGF